MSTRGWYEYYVLDTASATRSLAMQFYKWGDARPENAVEEWQVLQRQLDQAQGLLPVIWLDDLLREQLGDTYPNLPGHFSLGAFLFLIQRANEERSPFRCRDYGQLPEKQQPDYRLGFAVGKAEVLNGFRPMNHQDPLLDAVRFFIAAGHFVRPWKDYALTWSVLHWLQYLTQITLESDMGSIAGDLNRSWDCTYVYRFFIWTDPSELFRISRIALQICDQAGDDLLSALEQQGGKPDAEAADDRKEAAKVRGLIAKFGVNTYSLREAVADFAPEEDCFWGRACYERPPLIENPTTIEGAK